jgi:hypothetical protein
MRPIRLLALTSLVAAIGCSADDSTQESLPKPGRSSKRETCPGGDCWGLHSFTPPGTCDSCGARDLPTSHWLCAACAAARQRCAHCAGKLHAPQAQETPQAPPAPPEPKAEAPSPPAPTPAPPLPAEAPGPVEKLTVKSVDLSDADRQNHSVIVFAAEREHAKAALAAHRTHKEELIRLLPVPAAGRDIGLYMIWGHYPAPNITEAHFKAEFDSKTHRIKVTLPPFTGHRPDSGIGMDWGVDRNRTWTFVGFRAHLATLPPGEYTYAVVEVPPDGKAPRTLSEGTLTLGK